VETRWQRLRDYAEKWRRYEVNSLPWNRLQIHREFLHRGAYVRWPVQGDVLTYFREGRFDVARGVHFEPNVWISVLQGGRLTIGELTYLNMGVFVSVLHSVEIGAHCMFANGCFISDADHRFDDPGLPVHWQGLTSKGPTKIEDNVWCGVNVVITSGVTIGRRSVIGANSVVTSDIPPYSIAVGAPARVVATIEYGARQ
jgi:acetyltransferase-like isoleucine patch superfamily enzyme